VVVIRSHLAAATAATMRGDVDLRGRAAVDAFVDVTSRLLSQPFRRSHVRIHALCVRVGPTTDAPCACTARRGSTTGAGPYETVPPL